MTFGDTPAGVLADIPASEYHDDPGDTPSLSASIANILINQSPAHARAAHPKLNPDFERTEEQKFDRGTAAHALLLQGIDVAHVCHYPDWRTNDAKDARDQARAHGRIPLLAKDWDGVRDMVEAVRQQLDDLNIDPPLLAEGKPEQTLIWEDRGVQCRARLDWLRDDHTAVDDLKTTSRSANPEAYSRALFGVGGDVQAAFYLRGLEVALGVTPAWRWIVVETYPPYALSVISPGPAVLTLARKKVDYALSTWRRCLTTDDWPAYPNEICWAELPSWEETRWLEREAREEATA